MTEDTTNFADVELADSLKSLISNTPNSSDHQNVHTFLNNVAFAEDTTKLGNLTAEEVGTPKLPLRTYKELALFCSEVANMKFYADYLNKKAEILTSTSLSKEAMLINLAVIQRREFSQKVKARTINKGWFGQKKTSPTEVEV